MKQGWSGLMVFGASFVISLASMMIVVMLVVSFQVKDEVAAKQPHEIDLTMENYLPSQEENRNVLLIFCDEREEDPFSFFYLQFHPAEAEILLTALPSDIQTEVNGRRDTLLGQYQYAGSKNAALAAATLFAGEETNYIRFYRQGIENLVGWLGGIPLELTEKMEIGGKEYGPGIVQLDGEAFFSWLTEDPGNAFSLFLRNALTTKLLNEENILPVTFFQNADTNIMRYDLSQLKQAFRYFLNHPNKRVRTASWGEKKIGAS